MTSKTVSWTDIAPEQDVGFEVPGSGTHIQAFLNGKPMYGTMIFTPPFVTSFPKLSSDIEDPKAEKIEVVKRATLSVDLTMKGAGSLQKDFRDWMDAVDDRLLDFMMKPENVRIFGKPGLSREAMKALQKRQFRPRISSKTGKQYEDSMSCHCKAFWTQGMRHNMTYGRNTVPVRMPDGEIVEANQAYETQNPVPYGSNVAVCLRYDGPYCSPNQYFGNSWSLVSVRNYGASTESPDAADVFMFPELKTSDFPVPV